MRLSSDKSINHIVLTKLLCGSINLTRVNIEGLERVNFFRGSKS